MKEDSINTYRIELIEHTKKEQEDFDKDQMNRLRVLFLGEENNKRCGTTFLRIFTGKRTYETIKKVRTINFLRKITKLKNHKLPNEIVCNWENNKDAKRKSNCRKMWELHKDISTK